MNDTVPVVAVVVGLIACVVFSLFLIMSGEGDHAQSYRAWILAGSVILGSGIIGSAIVNRRNKQAGTWPAATGSEVESLHTPVVVVPEHVARVECAALDLDGLAVFPDLDGAGDSEGTGGGLRRGRQGGVDGDDPHDTPILEAAPQGRLPFGVRIAVDAERLIIVFGDQGLEEFSYDLDGNLFLGQAACP
jgi:hypothetical protein